MEMVDLYVKNKRLAIAQLLQIIENNMNEVVYQASDYKELRSIIHARNLYKPDNKILTSQEEANLNKKFIKGYNKCKNLPEIKELFSKMNDYKEFLNMVGISDA